MTTIAQPNTRDPVYELTATSPVRSHQSYDPLVEAVCHHSGRYLRRDEIIAQNGGLLYEQHDFPGFPELDALFQNAAHSQQHQHRIWSVPTLKGVALIIGGVAAIAAAVALWTRIGQYASELELIIAYTLIAVSSLAGLLSLAWAIRLIRRRTQLFHQAAHTPQPAIRDFPLFGSYRIDTEEAVAANLSNANSEPPTPTKSTGTLAIQVLPDERALGWYNQYATLYKQPPESLFIHAGAVALENVRGVTFDKAIEFMHRVPLRQPATQSFVTDGAANRKPLHFRADYTLQPQALQAKGAPEGRFLLELLPELAPYDSRTLVLRFRWLGASNLTCKLVECRIDFDFALDSVENVEQGRYIRTTGPGDLMWRNLLFHEGELALRVTFKKPLLDRHNPKEPLVLVGSYEIAVDGAISGLEIRPDHVWNALGRRADRPLDTQSGFNGTMPSIRSFSRISGKLEVNTSLLSQEHEFVKPDSIPLSMPPDHALVQKVVAKLTKECDVDVQRIEQALPRLDPESATRMQLRYWDILGRTYEGVMLEPIDIHVVISGSMVPKNDNGVQTQIDVRVRCLHDPRTTATRTCVEDTCASIATSLRSLNDANEDQA